ncbi:YIP1 family protein [Longimicrobium sp.]|uniref:YIP1 family protein n=1 Tax=Longimicrobium sp. TaxID=2029185 RepID=UPI002E34CEB8|nr:YIP1 family protein [Longimicrobium sp.]HEX6036735.1 YIP1 family protein [Longimicrobium sp.]
MSDFPISESPSVHEPHAAPAREPGPLGRRIVDTFFSPIALFQRFGTHAPWIDVLLISVVLTAALALLMPRDLLVAQIQEAMRQQPQGSGPTPSMDTMVMFGRIGAVVSQLVMVPIVSLAVAGLCTLLFGVMMGGGATYRQHLAVVSHAGLVMPLGFAVTLLFMVLGSNPTAQLSLALLVPGLEAETFAFRVLNALGVFTLWQLALVGVGAASVNRRVSPWTGVGVVFALYLAIVVLFAALRG